MFIQDQCSAVSYQVDGWTSACRETRLKTSTWSEQDEEEQSMKTEPCCGAQMLLLNVSLNEKQL